MKRENAWKVAAFCK